MTDRANRCCSRTSSAAGRPWTHLRARALTGQAERAARRERVRLLRR